jgi:dienelactone hydrolase
MPVISIPDVACGGVMGRLASGNFMLDDRPMIVTYPCEKHAGAPATFILNLHGTTPVEQHFYQHGYFSAHTFAASHNLIIVTPSSVVQQWGREDDGKDEPHLMKIIDWVYANLNGAGKFNIKSMWVGGHSWGGGYTARFGCKPELADKVKGLIMMSGGGITSAGGAACASKVAVIMTTAEGDNRMPGDQSMLAMTHGCDPGQSQVILNNQHSFWAACDPGFVHANYYMLGKEHATSMDKDVVESIVNWIKLARQ